MGSVYSIASHTIIYLGDSCRETDAVFAELSSLWPGDRVPLSVESIYSKYSDAAIEVLCNTIQRHIVENPWFTRVWIFQELLLSRDPWVQCGSKRLRWGELCRLSLLAEANRVNCAAEEKIWKAKTQLKKYPLYCTKFCKCRVPARNWGSRSS